MEQNNSQTTKKDTELTKDNLLAFVKNDLIPLVEQQEGTKFSDRARMARAIYFVLKHRTVENWGPREMSYGDAMGEAMRVEI